MRECKFHPANHFGQLNGCFAPGLAKWDINRDGHQDMINSGHAFDEFMDAMGNDDKARLVIINDQG